MRTQSITNEALRLVTAAAICLTAAATASAQAPKTQYEPTVGQEGKDAVWVPTSAAMVEKMLDHAKVTPQDFVMDLGSGDGRTIIAAARRGARGLGVEYNADLVEYSKRQAAAAGVADRAQFVQGDMYAADISKATVLALFLLPANIEKLVPKFLDLPPGTRIVANTFWVPDWKPEDTQTLSEGCENWCTSHLFIIPAKAAGTWRVPTGGTITLKQQFQVVDGSFRGEDGSSAPVTGRIRGKTISLMIGDIEYDGTIEGDTMSGAPKGVPGAERVTVTRVK